jgi:hypothetical protein
MTTRCMSGSPNSCLGLRFERPGRYFATVLPGIDYADGSDVSRPTAGLHMGSRLHGLVGTRTEQICLSRASGEKPWVQREQGYVEPSSGRTRTRCRRENCSSLDRRRRDPSSAHGHGLSPRGAGYRDGATGTLQERGPAQHAHATWPIRVIATNQGGPPADGLTLRIDECRRDQNTRLRWPAKVRATGAVRSLLRVSVRQVGCALRCARAHHLMDRVNLMDAVDPMRGFDPMQSREFGRA